ncbi:unnamed protein product [Penicillium salamii]|nr:unnamed protein product [Penicillium salamii]CAG8262334.1 unnamed protein product [Penicillium salamii]
MEPVCNTLLASNTLPSGAVVRVFSRLKHVEIEAKKIIEKLESESEKDGNQFLVLLKLTSRISKRLFEDHGCLEGVNYRFEFENDTGILRVVPGYRHDFTTRGLFQTVTSQLKHMGFVRQFRWRGATIHQSLSREKEGDQVFYPSTRFPSSNNLPWPTLVIETGTFESSSKLLDDAKWWFGASEGKVRMVILILIKKTIVRFQQWQLASPDAPRPLTRTYITTLRQNPNDTPYLQQPYLCAEVDVTQTTIDGAPLKIPYCGLFDVPVRPSDMQDVVLDEKELRFITELDFS